PTRSKDFVYTTCGSYSTSPSSLDPLTWPRVESSSGEEGEESLSSDRTFRLREVFFFLVFGFSTTLTTLLHCFFAKKRQLVQSRLAFQQGQTLLQLPLHGQQPTRALFYFFSCPLFWRT